MNIYYNPNMPLQPATNLNAQGLTVPTAVPAAMVTPYQNQNVTQYEPLDHVTTIYLAQATQLLAESSRTKDFENNSLKAEIQRLSAKQRRKLTSVSMDVSTNQTIQLVSQYSSGNDDRKTLILNCTGPIKIVNVEFSGLKLDPAYVILALGKETMIICEYNKIQSKSYLYTQFIQAGVVFNPEIAECKIKVALWNYFLPRIKSISDKITLPAFAGWDEQWEFHSRETVPPDDCFPKVQLPIAGKSFQRITPSQAGLEEYCQEMNQFSDPIQRAVIMVYPFLGLFHSLFERAQQPLRFYLNIIPTDDLPIDWISSWFQIFNRKVLAACSATNSERVFHQTLESSKDEVILVDALEYLGEPQYSKKKQQENVAHLHNIVNRGATTIHGQKLTAAVAMISGEKRFGNVINIILPGEDSFNPVVHNKFVHNQCLEQVMTGVLTFVKNNVDTVNTIFRKKRNLSDSRLTPFAIAFDILNAFATDMGYELKAELKLPDVTALKSLFYNEADSSEYQRNDFIRIVRESSEQLYAYVKRYNGDFHKKSFFYDNQYIYFPCTLMQDQFKRKKHLLESVLVDLRKDGILVTESPSSTSKKAQFGNLRIRCYIFPRSFFNLPGTADIVGLAQEEEQ